MEQSEYYWDILDELDCLDFPLTDWEVDFIESLMANRGRKLTEKQMSTIEVMKERYLL